MKTFIFYTMICLFSLSLAAQENNTFRGKVLYMSSNKTPAVGVGVSGVVKAVGSANLVYTTSNGAYLLVFPRPGVGKRVRLNVGDTDAKGQKLEIINERAIEIVRIPAIPTYEFEIVVARAGKRDSVAEHYYEVFKRSAEEEIKNIRKKIDDLYAKRKKNRKKIREYEERYDRLQRQNDSIALFREAYRLASINRDNASERLIKYLELLDAGRSVREAREVLSVEAATEELHESILDFRDAREELEYRAEASASLFDYEDAIKAYNDIIVGQEGLEIDRAIKAPYYARIAYMFSKNGNYNSALNYRKQVVAILEKLLDPSSSELAVAYNDLGSTYRMLQQTDSALSYHKKAIRIQKNMLNPEHPDLAASYHHIALAYRAKGRYVKALNYHRQSIGIREKILNPEHPDLAATYHAMALTWQSMKQYENALKYHRRAITIREQILGDDHPERGRSYMQTGITYAALHDIQTALQWLEKSLAIFEEALRKDHPYTKKALGTIGYINVRSNRFKAASEAFTAYEKRFPDDALTYRNWAVYYALQNENGKALENLQKAVKLGYKDVKWLQNDNSMNALKREKEFRQIIEKLKKAQ